MWFAPLILLAGGFIAGIMNSVAGGGSLFIYPILIALGIPPIVANATTGAAVLPGSLSSAYGYRKHLRKLPVRYWLIILPSIIGGIIGAVALRNTSDQDFSRIVPWFLLLGVSLIIAQPRLIKWARKKRGHHKRNAMHTLFWLAAGASLISIYGGYFGAGYAIVLLAFLGFTELTDIHEMNGYKNIVSVAVNFTSTAYLVYFGLLKWDILPWLLIGNVVGGYLGATYSTHLPKKTIRFVIIVIGLGVTAILFARG